MFVWLYKILQGVVSEKNQWIYEIDRENFDPYELSNPAPIKIISFVTAFFVLLFSC